jgi:hypothetical protein
MVEGKAMKGISKLSLMLIVFTLSFAVLGKVQVQASEENMKTFFDSEVSGIKIQVNATAWTQPTQNMTVILSLGARTSVHVETFRFDLFGFLNGTSKIPMANVTDENFTLHDDAKMYNRTVQVPDKAWGVTYGLFTMTYSADLGGVILTFLNMTSGFYMTNVENTFLESLENQLRTLNESYQQLNSTYWQLQENYTVLQAASMNDLDSTRRVAVILAVTTVFFVVTTVFLVMRRPKEIW